MQWSAPWLREKGVESARLDAELLLAETLGLARIALFLDPDRPLLPDELAAFKVLLKRRARREPVAYILGRRDFWRETFAVGPGVLIPRPESEGLLEAVIERFPDREAPLNMLEVGVGSGAVLGSLLQEYPQARGVGVDCSAAALAIAAENGARIGVAERLTLMKGDLTAPLDPGLDAHRFQVIVSNPPYVSTAELTEVAPEVAEWEPRQALDGGADGLAVLRRLPAACLPFLERDGFLALEIGCRQGQAVAALVAAAGFQAVTVRPDYSRHPRIVTASHPGAQ